MAASSAKASQDAYGAIWRRTVIPASQPRTTFAAWKVPKLSPRRIGRYARMSRKVKSAARATARASIERATASPRRSDQGTPEDATPVGRARL